MKSTIFMILMMVEFLLYSLPEYKMNVSLWKSEAMKNSSYLTTKEFISFRKIAFAVETILFVAACVIFVLKCLGAISWW